MIYSISNKCNTRITHKRSSNVANTPLNSITEKNLKIENPAKCAKRTPTNYLKINWSFKIMGSDLLIRSMIIGKYLLVENNIQKLKEDEYNHNTSVQWSLWRSWNGKERHLSNWSQGRKLEHSMLLFEFYQILTKENYHTKNYQNEYW